MADLDTASKRISSVGLFGRILALPLPDNTIGQGDRQHIAWTYSGIAATAQAALAFVLDLNTRLWVYLADLYSVSPTDNTALVRRHLDGQSSGDATQRFKRLIDDATSAMQ